MGFSKQLTVKFKVEIFHTLAPYWKMSQKGFFLKSNIFSAGSHRAILTNQYRPVKRLQLCDIVFIFDLGIWGGVRVVTEFSYNLFYFSEIDYMFFVLGLKVF